LVKKNKKVLKKKKAKKKKKGESEKGQFMPLKFVMMKKKKDV